MTLNVQSITEFPIECFHISPTRRSMATLDIFTINSMDYVAFISKFGNVVESNPFVAAAVWTRRPFSDFNSIYQAFCDIFENLPTFGEYSSIQFSVIQRNSNLNTKIGREELNKTSEQDRAFRII